jgi:hypothetical protein
LVFLAGRCTVLMLYLASNLLIFPETVRMYGIMAVPIGLCSGVMDFFSLCGELVVFPLYRNRYFGVYSSDVAILLPGRWSSPDQSK